MDHFLEQFQQMTQSMLLSNSGASYNLTENGSSSNCNSGGISTSNDDCGVDGYSIDVG